MNIVFFFYWKYPYNNSLISASKAYAMYISNGSKLDWTDSGVTQLTLQKLYLRNNTLKAVLE